MEVITQCQYSLENRVQSSQLTSEEGSDCRKSVLFHSKKLHSFFNWSVNFTPVRNLDNGNLLILQIGTILVQSCILQLVQTCAITKSSRWLF